MKGAPVVFVIEASGHPTIARVSLFLGLVILTVVVS